MGGGRTRWKKRPALMDRLEEKYPVPDYVAEDYEKALRLITETEIKAAA